MATNRTLLAVSACSLLLGGSLFAQGNAPAAGQAAAPTYFQSLVKDAKTRIKEINVDQFKAVRAASPAPVVVDVREDNEWAKGRIPGAIHVGRGVLENSIAGSVPDKSTPVIVYCHSGNRSAVSADVLGKMGYTNVKSLAGGIAGYQAAGLPIDEAAPAK
jgi:phage shock protein E